MYAEPDSVVVTDPSAITTKAPNQVVIHDRLVKPKS